MSISKRNVMSRLRFFSRDHKVSPLENTPEFQNSEWGIDNLLNPTLPPFSPPFQPSSSSCPSYIPSPSQPTAVFFLSVIRLQPLWSNISLPNFKPTVCFSEAETFPKSSTLFLLKKTMVCPQPEKDG